MVNMNKSFNLTFRGASSCCTVGCPAAADHNEAQSEYVFSPTAVAVYCPVQRYMNCGTDASFSIRRNCRPSGSAVPSVCT